MFGRNKDVHTHDTIYTTRTKIQLLMLQSIQIKRATYGIQSPHHQFSSCVHSVYLGAKGKSHWRGANELAWKTISSLF